MMNSPRRNFVSSAVLASLFAVPALVACGDDNPLSAACCTDYQVGADVQSVDFGVDASLKGQFNSFAQASSDFSAAATATLNELETACRNIAVDLGAEQADRDAADVNTGAARMTAWCNLAVARIGGNAALKGGVTVEYTDPVCSASFSAKANCQAKCDASVKCDIKANPPVCTGGRMEIACKGDCTASAGATLTCEGQCTGSCEGSCEASGGVAVECDGRCEGTCAAGGSASASGIQADGTCKGTCNGKCTLKKGVKVECKGTCSGECSATCRGSAQVAARCDGTCSIDAEPLRCEGGKLEGGCQASGNCEANCSASAQAKAECTPPALRVLVGGSATASAEATLALNSLEQNLPQVLLVFKARGQQFVDLGKAIVTASSGIVANTGSLGVKGTACSVVIGGTLNTAVSNVTASVSASAAVATAVKVK